MAKDPICGMFVEEGPHALTVTLHGTRYFFCSESCLVQFQAPEKALAQLKRLLVIGTVLTVPITAFTYLPIVRLGTSTTLSCFSSRSRSSSWWDSDSTAALTTPFGHESGTWTCSSLWERRRRGRTAL